jgi:transposase
MPQRRQSPYPLEFREEAVRLVRTSGRPIPEIAAELGVNGQTLRNCLFAANADPNEPEALSTDDREELNRLRRRVKVLEQERDILKKAAARFAKETGSTP